MGGLLALLSQSTMSGHCANNVRGGGDLETVHAVVDEVFGLAAAMVAVLSEVAGEVVGVALALQGVREAGLQDH